MKFGLPEKALKRIIEVFKKHPQVDQVLLYGSRAKGNFKPSSDIDLTVIAPELKWKDINRISLELDDLLLPYSIDISLYHHISDPDVLDHIKRVGKNFYQKNG
ncbi:MAG: nucleotidyltransferase domain-containing protein [Bacteroidia bacterium]